MPYYVAGCCLLQSATANVTVTVSNANDNDPEFGRDVYTFNVPENARNHVVGTVSATDNDLSNSNTLRYRLEYQNRSALCSSSLLLWLFLVNVLGNVFHIVAPIVY